MLGTPGDRVAQTYKTSNDTCDGLFISMSSRQSVQVNTSRQVKSNPSICVNICFDSNDRQISNFFSDESGRVMVFLNTQEQLLSVPEIGLGFSKQKNAKKAKDSRI